MKLPEGCNKVHWTEDGDADDDDEESIGFGSKSNNNSKVNNKNIDDVGENRPTVYSESNNNVISNYFIMNTVCYYLYII